jgi:transcriptional regulator GlxA family with amidase domain
MSRATEDRNRRMLRARDAMDRAFAQPLDVPALAALTHVSTAHFSRTFGAIVGESPSAYRAPFAGDGAALRVPACWAMAWLRPAG